MSYNLLAKSISTSNHMFGRAIWDKLPKCIFENFEIAWVKWGQFQNFQKSWGWLLPELPEPNMWLLVNHTKPTVTASNYKSASKQLEYSGQLQNNTVNNAMLKTTNRVIDKVI